jgi:hypothetical protein
MRPPCPPAWQRSRPATTGAEHDTMGVADSGPTATDPEVGFNAPAD